MAAEQFKLRFNPKARRSRMVLAFTGWMDGGEVSTGTVGYLAQHVGAERVAEIEPEDFYLLNFPGTMEVSALFRPGVRIRDGLIEAYEMPTNYFYWAEKPNLILFEGREPNIRWDSYADCLLEAARVFDCEAVYFIGSVAGMTPHTREPRLTSSVSHAGAKAPLEAIGARFSQYEGPASLVTHLMHRAAGGPVPVSTLVAEIPAYIQGRNPRGIESLARRLAGLLGIEVDLEDLRVLSDQWEHKLNEMVAEKPELAELIAKLEQDYDNDVFNREMHDLKSWLERQGLRLD